MNQNLENVSIPLSKNKMFFSLVIALGFVGIGIWLAFFNEVPRFNTNPFIISFLGWITILFFGVAAVIILRKLFLPSQGLYIDNNGILDSSSGISAGFIPWNDIASIGEVIVMSQKFVSIQLKNPEEFIASRSNKFTQKAMTVNHQKFGSAVSISANNLKINHIQLLQLLETNLKKYNNTHNLYQTN